MICLRIPLGESRGVAPISNRDLNERSRARPDLPFAERLPDTSRGRSSPILGMLTKFTRPQLLSRFAGRNENSRRELARGRGALTFMNGI